MKKFVIMSDQRSSGKTTVCAFIAALLDRNQIKINYLKLNQALSTRIGLLNPLLVGEAFVTKDGGQVDKDVGVIERSISYSLASSSCLTLGQAINQVNITENSTKDCGFDFLSMDVQLLSYISDYVKQFDNDYISLIELGGAIFDLGNQAFLQSIIKLLKLDDCTTIFIGDNLDLFHTLFGCKPGFHIQKSDVQLLRKREISNPVQFQITNIMQSYLNIILAPFDVEDSYLHTPYSGTDNELKIAIVGRYVEKYSAYLSIYESLQFSGEKQGYTVQLVSVHSKFLTQKNVEENLSYVDGVCIPGGFGDIGVEGIIIAIQYCRLHKKPIFGICFGFQLMVIEYARNVCNMIDAHTYEINPNSPFLVIDRLDRVFESRNQSDGKYSCMRLGDLKINFSNEEISQYFFEKERHWHSYGINMKLWEQLHNNGLEDVIWDEDNKLVVGIRLSNHPFYIATQFHPEFKSHYKQPHKIFIAFIRAAAKYSGSKKTSTQVDGFNLFIQ